MSDLFAFFRQVGGLHDAVLRSLLWDTASARVEFEFDDIFANYEGYPDYPGEILGRVCLEGVRDVVMELNTQERPSVTDSFRVEGPTNTVEFNFLPAGRIRATFERASFPDPPEEHLPPRGAQG